MHSGVLTVLMLLMAVSNTSNKYFKMKTSPHRPVAYCDRLKKTIWDFSISEYAAQLGDSSKVSMEGSSQGELQ